jgi:beta-barrel assembly-enhancing protease
LQVLGFNMMRKISLTIAVCTAVLTGCSGDGKFDAGKLGDMVGGQGGHLIKAGAHVLNAASLSEKDEDAIGQSVGVALTNQMGVTSDARLQHYVMLVGLTVASASPNPSGNWVFGVLESPQVNAFSGPNGYVFVTRGAIMRMRDEAELAGVLAHEISHVCHHDGLKQVQAAEQRGALSETLKAGDARAQQFAALADAGVDAITKQGYSQPQEFDADKSGVEIMRTAGYDTASYLRFLQRLQAESGSKGGTLMSTHPGIGERVSRVSKQLQGTPHGGATLSERFNANVGGPR